MDNKQKVINKIVLVVSTYQNLIESLIGNQPPNQMPNIIIGGSAALHLHGLNFRDLLDLDIIIYKPSPAQQLILEGIKAFDTISNYRTQKEERRVIKLQKDRNPTGEKRDYQVLDIIIEKDKEIPSGLLTVKINGITFPVQSIDKVIEAKASYRFHSDDVNLSNYVREKDLKDLLDLKNDNFNLNPPTSKETIILDLELKR